MKAKSATWSETCSCTVRIGFVLIAATLMLPSEVRAQGAAAPIEIEILPASGVAGDSVEMAVVLHTDGQDISGIQVDIDAASPLSIAITDAQKPNCWRNTDLDKDHTVYSFPLRSNGEWTRMRSLVLSLTNVTPIPDGALLFTCQVDIAADAAPGEYQLTSLRLLGSTPQGDPVDAIGTGGTVLVADATEGSVPLDVGDTNASGGCTIEPSQSGLVSALLLVLPLALWRLRPRKAESPARRPH